MGMLKKNKKEEGKCRCGISRVLPTEKGWKCLDCGKEKPPQSEEVRCCEKCACKHKGAYTAHYGCDNNLCNCHRPLQQDSKGEWREKWNTFIKDVREYGEFPETLASHVEDFIQSLLDTEREKAYEDDVHEKALKVMLKDELKEEIITILKKSKEDSPHIWQAGLNQLITKIKEL